MRILVTGVSGQVGGALVPRLAPLGEVLPADETVLDFAVPERLPAALDRLAPNLIVNPAAYTAVDKAEDEPDLAMTVNAEAPGALARWAAQRDVPLIHFSTDYVYDGSGERPWREDDEPRPLSVYGASKLAGDRAIAAAGGTFLILRTSWVYDAHGKNFLRTIARLARERAELRIVGDQVGAPTSAAAIADVVTQMITSGLESLRRRSREAQGLVHMTTGGSISWHGFACAIVEGLRQRGVALAADKIVAIRTDEYPTRAKRPHNSRLDLGRLNHVFGIMSPSWETALGPELDALAREMHGSGAAS